MALTVWAGNWALVIIVVQIEPPSSWNHRKRKIQSPAIWKTYKTSLAGVKSTGGFFSPTRVHKTIGPGAV